MIVRLLPVELTVRGSADPALLLLPLIVALLFCFVLGLSLALSVLHAHYRDVEPVLATALLPWFFVTPIFLRVDDLPGVDSHPWIGDVLKWGNPVAPFVDSVRSVLYAGTAPGIGELAYLVGVGL